MAPRATEPTDQLECIKLIVYRTPERYQSIEARLMCVWECLIIRCYTLTRQCFRNKRRRVCCGGAHREKRTGSTPAFCLVSIAAVGALGLRLVGRFNLAVFFFLFFFIFFQLMDAARMSGRAFSTAGEKCFTNFHVPECANGFYLGMRYPSTYHRCPATRIGIQPNKI